MTQPAPSFPAFNEWQSMSESEQDALLDRLETKQRGSIFKRVVAGVLAAAVCAATCAMLLMMRA